MSRNFATTLTRTRTAHNISQSKLAVLAGVERSYFSRLESGGRNPSRQTVDAIAAALSLPEADRIELLRAAGFDAGHELTHPLALRLDLALREMDDEERSHVEQMMDSLLRLVSWRDGAPVLRRVA